MFDSLPFTMLKYLDCMASVIGPRFPFPIIRLSISLMGVISAAVPVKNSSSAKNSWSRIRLSNRSSIFISLASI